MEERQPEKRNDRNNRNRNRNRNRGNRSGGPREDRVPGAKPDEIMAYVDEADEPAGNEESPAGTAKNDAADTPRPEAGRVESTRSESGRSDHQRGERGNGRPESNRQRDNTQRQERDRQGNNRQRNENREADSRPDGARSEAGAPDMSRSENIGRQSPPNQRERGDRDRSRGERGRDREPNRDRDADRERPARQEPALIQEWNREDELRPSDLRPGESRLGEKKIADLAGRGADIPPEERLVIGISLGDYNGISPEVILKALQYNQLQRVCTPVIYGSMRVLNRYRNLLNLKDWNLNGIQDVEQASHKMTNVITCWSENTRPAPAAEPVAGLPQEGEPTEQPTETPTDEAVGEEPEAPKNETGVVASPTVSTHEIQPGKVTAEAGQAALLCLERAVADLKAGKLDGLVTGPINKHNIQSETFKFPGHTEYLAQAFGVPDDLMFMVGETLRVGVVTGHVPLARVRQYVTRPAIHQKLTMMMQSLRVDFGIQKPRIAVLGLNPHAGENGLLGTEEQETISPVIEEWRKKGELVYGPFPADGFFGTRAYRKYDAVLAMYHDQGLIPFKAIAFEEGVNFTAGLPIVRTSPDHGTAYDIAGKNLADETSMTQAIYLACDVARRRKEYKTTEANALKR